MSEKSDELLMGLSVMPPEEDDNDSDTQNARDERAIYESSKRDILDHINKDTFQNVWLTLKNDIQNRTVKLQRIFLEQILDKISEIYDFTFPENIESDTIYAIWNGYSFLEFIEYKNVKFITYVWKFLKDNIIHLDIEKYCKANANKVIAEIDEQLDAHPQDSLIAIFLRTYYKEKVIEWFIQNSIKNRVEITIENLRE